MKNLNLTKNVAECCYAVPIKIQLDKTISYENKEQKRSLDLKKLEHFFYIKSWKSRH